MLEVFLCPNPLQFLCVRRSSSCRAASKPQLLCLREAHHIAQHPILMGQDAFSQPHRLRDLQRGCELHRDHG